MNLLYDALPESIQVDEKEYPICTDFRDWIKFVDLMEDGELNDNEKIEYALKWFTREIPKNLPAAFRGLFWFFSCGESGEKGSPKRPVFSFRVDAPYILAAFRQSYGLDLQAIDYLHWWEFRSLFDGLPEDCELKKRIAYRGIKLSSIQNREERSRIRKIQQAIALPRKIQDEEIGAVFEGVFGGT